jgi:hypothetical protein
MAESRSVRFLGLLRVLLRHEVEFFVVGGVAAQLEGAPILTFDLDVLYDKAPENLDTEKLATLRMHLLLTELGPLDVLGTIGKGLTYRDLVSRTIAFELGEARVLVLELAAVIETKEHANRDKDRAVLPVLRQTLAMKTRGESPKSPQGV